VSEPGRRENGDYRVGSGAWKRKKGGGGRAAWCEGRRDLAGAPTQVRQTRVTRCAGTGEGRDRHVGHGGGGYWAGCYGLGPVNSAFSELN
jgi:hypothetical protein